MSNRTYRLDIITPERRLLSDDQVVSIVAPTYDGYIGVLADHAPLMTELGIGKLDVTRADDSTRAFAVAGGFIEVLDNVVTVLADVAEADSEIDVDRAEQARRRAEEQLKAHNSEIDIEVVRVEMMRALNRLTVGSRSRGRGQ